MTLPSQHRLQEELNRVIERDDVERQHIRRMQAKMDRYDSLFKQLGDSIESDTQMYRTIVQTARKILNDFSRQEMER